MIKSKVTTEEMCHGPLAGNLILYTLPIVLTGVLQLLFSAVGMIIVGQFAPEGSLAAIGSTGALINLIINVFLGLSVGANVTTARYFGEGNKEGVSEVAHTSIVTSVFGGIITMIVGVIFSETFLLWMGTPDDIIDLAALYMRVYFYGLPALMLYNYGAAILRAAGDTKNPLYFLSAAGVINVVLGLVFVIVFKMGVAGAALATAISQYIAAFLVLRFLMKSTGWERIDLRRLRIHKDKLKKILLIGLPAGIQGSVFSISNVVIQSSVNSFGSVFMEGSSAAANIEGFVYTAMNSFYHAAVTFTGQNFGAKNYRRINKILLTCIVMVTVTGIVLGFLAYLHRYQLLGLYCPDSPEAIEAGIIRMRMICLLYFFCGIMEVIVGSVRGLGASVTPMVVSLLGACGLRIVWIKTVFHALRTPTSLFVSYPISWAITASAHMICYVIIKKRLVSRVSDVGVLPDAEAELICR